MVITGTGRAAISSSLSNGLNRMIPLGRYWHKAWIADSSSFFVSCLERFPGRTASDKHERKDVYRRPGRIPVCIQPGSGADVRRSVCIQFPGHDHFSCGAEVYRERNDGRSSERLDDWRI